MPSPVDSNPNHRSGSLLEEAIALSGKSLSGALELANQALELAESDGEPEQVNQVLSFRAQLHTQLHRTSKAIADAERALKGHTERGNERGQAGVLNTLAIIREHTGDYTESFNLQSQCLEILCTLDAAPAVAQLASNMGLTCTYVGDWKQAIQFYKESLATWDKLPPQTGKALLLVNLGFAHATLDQYDLAECYYRDALELFGDQDPLHTCLVYTNLARALLKQGNLEEATRLADIGLRQSQQQEDPSRQAHALECMGAIHRAQGNMEGARVAFEKALSIYREIPIPRGSAIILTELAKLSGDDLEQARQLLEQAETMARRSGLKPILIEILGHFHALSKRQGAWEEACSYLEQKVEAERALIKDHTHIRLKTLQMDLDLEQSQRETELERQKSKKLTDAVAELETQKLIAEEESRQKSEILHFAAHDLRNLLWGILGPAELIEDEREKLADHPLLLDLVQSMQLSANDLQDTLNTILTAATAESGEVKLERQDVFLEDLLSDAVGRWSPAAKAKKQHLEHIKSHPDLQLSIDPQRIRDCLHNLISNAIKYSPPGCTIRIGIERSEGFVSFFVADAGPGLNSEDKKRAGQLFQRLSAKPTAGEMSIGVGLAVVKRFSELHGGRMDIECPPGGGSIFRIVLPSGQ